MRKFPISLETDGYFLSITCTFSNVTFANSYGGLSSCPLFVNVCYHTYIIKIGKFVTTWSNKDRLIEAAFSGI